MYLLNEKNFVLSKSISKPSSYIMVHVPFLLDSLTPRTTSLASKFTVI